MAAESVSGGGNGAGTGGFSDSYDYLFKFLVIGSAGTGKSCLLHQFIEGRFKEDSSHTIGVEFGSKIVPVGGQAVKLQVSSLHDRSSARSTNSGVSLDLGHCRTGTVSVGHQELLPGCRRWVFGPKRVGCLSISVILVPGALLVYDVTSRESFNSLSNWLADARTLASPSIVILLVGNKKDLEEEREVTFLEASR